MKHYDCIIIGTGPAGQKGAIQAAKLGKPMADVTDNKRFKGSCRDPLSIAFGFGRSVQQ